MQLKNLKLSRKVIGFTVVLNPDSDDKASAEEERKVTAREAPLPELIEAFAKLNPVICTLMEVPKDWTEGMSVSQITVSTTKEGTRSVAFTFKKPLNAIGGLLHSFTTPLVRIDKPADGESGVQEVTAKDAKLILKALHECERYAKGERSQQLLDLESAAEALNAQAHEGEGLF